MLKFHNEKNSPQLRVAYISSIDVTLIKQLAKPGPIVSPMPTILVPAADI